MSEREIGRVSRAAGITREQARKAINAMDEPPAGGPLYLKRMAYIRDAAYSLGMNAWHLSDAELEKRVGKFPRVGALIRMAKDADRENGFAR